MYCVSTIRYSRTLEPSVPTVRGCAWFYFFVGCAFVFLVIWVDGTLRLSGISGTRCFSGGIVFVDVLEVLDATLFRLFGLVVERTRHAVSLQ